MATTDTPLRYPGGKRRLKNYIRLTLKLNSMEGGLYVEPFAGGAAVALGLLFEEAVSQIMINDIDPTLYAFWYSVLNHTDELCEKIENTPVNVESWHQQKAIFTQCDIDDPVELGYATFFLNRTNRSGILSAGIIGGLSQTGEWKIDARFTKNNLITAIRKISKHKSQITLTKLDARAFIREYSSSFDKKTLTYLDPPYYHKGQKLYLNALEPDDHALIAHSVLNDLKTPWIISYDNTPEINDLYPNNRQASFPLRYSAANRYDGSEVIIYSDQLKIPEVENPFKLTKAKFTKRYKLLASKE